MITKITGEQPFQVLTNNFSISPSNEGYTLQISADGENYSNLFSVGAGVTRLVTGVAANSFYRLLGNNSQVSINWMKTCVTEGGGGTASGTELQPIENFPADAPAGTVVAYTGTSSASGVYQYDGTDWIPVGVDDLSAYWTSAQTQAYVEDKELPVAAAINDLKDNFEVRLDQQYYKKQEVNNLLNDKVTAGQVNEQIKDYTDPAIAEVYDTIEDKELPVSAALNELNNKISGSTYTLPAATDSTLGGVKIQQDGHLGYDLTGNIWVEGADLDVRSAFILMNNVEGVPEEPNDGDVVSTNKYKIIDWDDLDLTSITGDPENRWLGGKGSEYLKNVIIAGFPDGSVLTLYNDFDEPDTSFKIKCWAAPSKIYEEEGQPYFELGIGDSDTITVGDNTYTITLDLEDPDDTGSKRLYIETADGNGDPTDFDGILYRPIGGGVMNYTEETGWQQVYDKDTLPKNLVRNFGGVSGIIKLTQDQYDNLLEVDDNTLYIIINN